MKKHQKGFSVVEVLAVLVIVGLVAGIGWYVWQQRSKNNSESTSTQTSQANQADNTKTAQSAPYAFKELGITMNVLDGWQVKEAHTKEEGANFYKWTVEKPGADGKIVLGSSGFWGGFHQCSDTGNTLSAATVKEVATTQNTNLMFMSWSYSSAGNTYNVTSIVPTTETVFRATDNVNAAVIANKDVSAGTYYFCLSEPHAGTSLELNNEAAPSNYARRDTITALASSSSDSSYAPLPTTAQSYADIKAMLVTIK